MKRRADSRENCLICGVKSWDKICPLCHMEHPNVDSRQLEKKIAFQKRRNIANLAIAKPALRERIFTKDNRTCQKCGSTESITIHHIISVYMCGSNEDDNLTTYCRSCNSATNPD